MTDRYHIEDEMEPDSNESVYKNKLGITDPNNIEELETSLLAELYISVLESDAISRRLLIEDVFKWHLQWLGSLYEWAGEERSRNMAKDGFHFCAAHRIPHYLEEFQKKHLDMYTPVAGQTHEEVVCVLAETHAEFIIIHPFREGNGRVGRLLSDVMAVQNGYPPLDYSFIASEGKERYFQSIRESFYNDYSLITQLFTRLLPSKNVKRLY